MNEERQSKVGMIGLGIMGSAMARNLSSAGFAVTGYDISQPAMVTFAAAGGIASHGPADASPPGGIVVTSLPSAASLQATVAALTATAAPPSIVIETSTLPLAEKESAFRALANAGIALLDCPLSGTGAQALTKDVVVYGSGDPEAFDQCAQVFSGFSRAFFNLGAFGAGTKMKLVANLLVAIHTAAAGEAFAFARAAGLEASDVLKLITMGAGSSRSLEARGEMLVANSFQPIRTMSLGLWQKDLDIIGAFSREIGCPAPLFDVATVLFKSALVMGLAEQDTAAVARVSARLVEKV